MAFSTICKQKSANGLSRSRFLSFLILCLFSAQQTAQQSPGFFRVIACWQDGPL
jgi:hypothetical protein